MIKSVRIAFSISFVLLFFVSCVTQRRQECNARTVEQHTGAHSRDSIFVVDSVLVRERSDTVYLTRTRIQYREHLRIDTLWRIDTLISVKEVVKEVKNKSNGYKYFIVALIVILFLLYVGKRKITDIFLKEL